MTTSEERIGGIQGVLEQMNERLGSIESRLGAVENRLEQKADKTEMRLLFVASLTLHIAIIGLLGAILARI